MAEAVGTPDEISRDGTVNINWQSDYAGYDELLVRKASGERLAAYPVIDDQSWSLSGLSNGDYLLELTGSEHSKQILSLRVRHYSLNSALSLFGLGLLLFAYLIVTLKRGAPNND